MSVTDDAILQKLKQIPLFEALRHDDVLLRKLCGICKRKRFTRGQTIIEENDVGEEMFIVYSGTVEIRKQTRAGDNYTVVILKAEYNVFSVS